MANTGNLRRSRGRQRETARSQSLVSGGRPALLVFACVCSCAAWFSAVAPTAIAAIPKALGGAPPVVSMPAQPISEGAQAASSRLHAEFCSPAVVPLARVDRSLDTLFSGQKGPGWVGGDATYSTRLPDGREAFDFSDTLVGTAQPDGRANVKVVHNSERVGYLPALRSVFQGNYASPHPLIPDGRGSSYQWEVAATYVERDVQLVFVNEFVPVAHSFYDRFTGRAGIAVLSVPLNGLPSYRGIVPLPADPTTRWGSAMVQAGGYDYVFGSDINPRTSSFYGMKVARVAVGQTLARTAWHYWNGTTWVRGESKAAPIPSSSLFTGVVARRGGGYMASAVSGGGKRPTTVDLSYSCSPQGPWSPLIRVYRVPQTEHFRGEIAYNATFHPELSDQSGWVLSYNIDNTRGLSALEQNVRQYQPQFLLLH